MQRAFESPPTQLTLKPGCRHSCECRCCCCCRPACKQAGKSLQASRVRSRLRLKCASVCSDCTETKLAGHTIHPLSQCLHPELKYHLGGVQPPGQPVPHLTPPRLQSHKPPSTSCNRTPRLRGFGIATNQCWCSRSARAQPCPQSSTPSFPGRRCLHGRRCQFCCEPTWLRGREITPPPKKDCLCYLQCSGIKTEPNASACLLSPPPPHRVRSKNTTGRTNNSTLGTHTQVSATTHATRPMHIPDQ
jgi:hypothetical protein